MPQIDRNAFVIKNPTGTLMKERVLWTFSECPRVCRHANKDTEHVLNFNKGDPTWERLKNTTEMGRK